MFLIMTYLKFVITRNVQNCLFVITRNDWYSKNLSLHSNSMLYHVMLSCLTRFNCSNVITHNGTIFYPFGKREYIRTVFGCVIQIIVIFQALV